MNDRSSNFRGRYVLRLLMLSITLTCSHPALSEDVDRRADRWLGLPTVESPASSTQEQAKASLGARLFGDARLSADGKISCESCHASDRLFSDGLPRSTGHAGREGTRNAPSLLNVIFVTPLFWDGRAADLASQARAPFTNAVEHALADEDALLQIVRGDASYSREFSRIFGSAPGVIGIEMITEVLVAFERTLVAGGSAFDRFLYGKQRSAMNPQAVRGFELFKGRAGCATCHSIGKDSSLLSDQQFHMAARGLSADATKDLGTLAAKVVTAKRSANSKALETLIATDANVAALGRFLATLQPADIGKFRTPSLRNVSLTAPYMHDGSVSTLEEAVDLELYSRGVVTVPIVLTRSEKSDLIEFLKMLSSAH